MRENDPINFYIQPNYSVPKYEILHSTFVMDQIFDVFNHYPDLGFGFEWENDEYPLDEGYRYDYYGHYGETINAGLFEFVSETIKNVISLVFSDEFVVEVSLFDTDILRVSIINSGYREYIGSVIKN